MTSYPFLKMAAATAQYYFWFRICWCRICWCHCLQKVKIYQQTKFRRHISIHGFRYWKTKCMPYWNYTSGFDLDYFAVIGEILHPRVPNFVQIRTYTAEIWRHVDFQDGGRQPYCICFEVMADHPRSAFRGLNSDLKSLVCRISSGDIAMYRFLRFGLKLPIHAPFWEFLGNIFPVWRQPLSWPPKGPSLSGNTSFEPFSVTISATVRPGGRIEEKNSITKKSQKCYISPIWGKPLLDRFDPKVAWWVMSAT